MPGETSEFRDLPGRNERLNRAERVLRRLVRRATVDDALDRLRLRLDLFPYRLYQPLPWLGLRTATRAAGSESRLTAITDVVRRLDVRSALDLGCNVGFFTISLASTGVATIGVESQPVGYRTAILAARRSGLSNVGTLVMGVRPETVALLPEADAVLMLSIWHHWVRGDGLDVADGIVRSVWERTRKVLFFDTGEAEMPASWGLPQMEPDPRTWIARHLERNCAGATIEHLGTHAAFDADGMPCERNLFAAIRR